MSPHSRRLSGSQHSAGVCSVMVLCFQQALLTPLRVTCVRPVASFYLFHGDIVELIISNELFFPHKMKSVHIRTVRLEFYSIILTYLVTASDENWLGKLLLYSQTVPRQDTGVPLGRESATLSEVSVAGTLWLSWSSSVLQGSQVSSHWEVHFRLCKCHLSLYLFLH